jgi:hypothetical protein
MNQDAIKCKGVNTATMISLVWMVDISTQLGLTLETVMDSADFWKIMERGCVHEVSREQSDLQRLMMFDQFIFEKYVRPFYL